MCFDIDDVFVIGMLDNIVQSLKVRRSKQLHSDY